MRLKRLKITDPNGFRSLGEGFEVHFLRDFDFEKTLDFNPYVLTGPNGSGKSNILEVLAAIFFHIECNYLNFRPPGFEHDQDGAPSGFLFEKSTPDAFELEYFIKVPEGYNQKRVDLFAHIKIAKELARTPVIEWTNRKIFNSDGETVLSKLELKNFLPDFVLAYSSGENEILSLPFFKMRFIQFDEYKENLIEKHSYGGVPEARLLFLDSEFNQAILLSNYLLQENSVLKPFQEEIGILDLKRFRIIIKNNIQLFSYQINTYLSKELQKDKVEVDDLVRKSEFIHEVDGDGETKLYDVEITNNLARQIDMLIKCSTSHIYDNDGNLILDYWVNEATKEAFRLHFGRPVDLFQAFQILLTLNLYSVSDSLKKDLYQSSSLYVNETVPTLPSDERIFRLKELEVTKRGVNGTILCKSLSDGEHQFLHSLGLCLLYKDSNALFLLDEPETHFNPDWRSKFTSRLRNCFELADKNKTREVLITTHSPFLISDSKKEYVLEFNKDEEGNVNVSRPDYNTLGASINKITMKSFGKKETIGGHAEDILNSFRKRMTLGEDRKKILEEMDLELGDSVEKTLFANQLLE